MFSYVTAEELEGLFHVGTLDIAKKSNQSLEWNGLSVSNCPDAWRRICGCSGTLWQLIPKEDSCFLLFHELDDFDHMRIEDWACEAGWFERDMTYRVSYWDEEYEEERFFLFASEEREMAYGEYQFKLEEGCDGVEIEECPYGLRATRLLEDASMVKIDVSMFGDIAVMLYAEEVLDADGLWWDDRFDPYALSAPRGVIFNSRIGRFEALACDNFK